MYAGVIRYPHVVELHGKSEWKCRDCYLVFEHIADVIGLCDHCPNCKRSGGNVCGSCGTSLV